MATILNILSYVSVLTLVALGLAIVFGLMDIVNLAHAEWVTMGAYTLAVAQSVGGQHAFWAALLAAPIVGAGGVLSASSFDCSMPVHWIRYWRPTRSV